MPCEPTVEPATVEPATAEPATVKSAAMESTAAAVETPAAASAMRSVGDLGLTDHGGEQQCSCNAC